jgi:GTP:adenosylcobinamide-phosphate guanylyltransferase
VTVDAVITAGGIPKPEDPLYPLTQGRNKALLPIGGVPMVQWIVDALGGADCIGRVVVVGLDPAEAALECRKPLSYVPNAGSMIGNVQAGAKQVLAQDANARHVLVVSADIPTITAEMVDWNVSTSLETDHDAYYSFIPAADMERRFPGSRRTFFKLKEGRFSGSDMNVFQTALVGKYHPAWQAIVDSRKNVFKQAGLVGVDTLLLLLLGRLSIAGAERAVLRHLGVHGRTFLSRYPETGMDVDKPHQYELVKRDLEARGRRV